MNHPKPTFEVFAPLGEDDFLVANAAVIDAVHAFYRTAEEEALPVPHDADASSEQRQLLGSLALTNGTYSLDANRRMEGTWSFTTPACEGPERVALRSYITVSATVDHLDDAHTAAAVLEGNARRKRGHAVRDESYLVRNRALLGVTGRKVWHGLARWYNFEDPETERQLRLRLGERLMDLPRLALTATTFLESTPRGLLWPDHRPPLELKTAKAHRFDEQAPTPSEALPAQLRVLRQVIAQGQAVPAI